MVLLILCAVGLEVGFLRTRDKGSCMFPYASSVWCLTPCVGRPAPSWWVTESFHWEYYLMVSELHTL